MFPSPTCRKNIQWHIKVVLGVLYRWGKLKLLPPASLGGR